MVLQYAPDLLKGALIFVILIVIISIIFVGYIIHRLRSKNYMQEDTKSLARNCHFKGTI